MGDQVEWRRRRRRDDDDAVVRAPEPSHRLLALQAAAGNAAVTRLVADRRQLARLTPPADLAKAQERAKAATDQHAAQTQLLIEWLAEGRRSADPVLKNACDWIAMGNSRLYAVTPTGDSDERATHHGRDPKQQRAYFPRVDDGNEGGDIANPSGGNYNWQDLDDQNHVKFKGVNTQGWNTATAIPSGIAVAGVPTAVGFIGFFLNATVNPVTQESFFTTIKHEVQHAADRSQDKFTAIGDQVDARVAANAAFLRLNNAVKSSTPLDPTDLGLVPQAVQTAFQNLHAARLNQAEFADADIDAIKAFTAQGKVELLELDALSDLEHYKTEYRAYSYQGTYTSFDNQANYDAQVPQQFLVAGRHWTERQYRVFRQIYLGYSHTSEGWQNNRQIFGSPLRFREAVLAYRHADQEGVNKLDSPRINTLYDKLLLVPANTAVANHQTVLDLEAVALTLTPLEAAYVRNAPGNRRELTTVLQAHLQGAALARIHAVLELRANA